MASVHGELSKKQQSIYGELSKKQQSIYGELSKKQESRQSRWSQHHEIQAKRAVSTDTPGAQDEGAQQCEGARKAPQDVDLGLPLKDESC